MSRSSWEALGEVSPRLLVEVRLLLHQAVQLVAAVGRCLVPPAADDGHTSLEWLSAPRCLAGQSVPGGRPWRAALRLEEPALVVLEGGVTAATRSLSGLTRSEALAWLSQIAVERGAAAERLTLDAPYAIPANAFAAGSPFSVGSRPALAEIASWFANADSLLRATTAGWPGAAPVRVWPHHFDVGSVLPLSAARGEGDPSIGVGLSPGDEAVAEPYLYVTPWPPPRPEEPLPALPGGGGWHCEGWVGALLTGSEIVSVGGAGAQANVAAAFLGGTLEALRARGLRRP